MISVKVINAILSSSATYNKDVVIKEMVKHIQGGYDYNDNKVNHILEMLVDSLSVYTEEDINLDWIEENINSLVYKSEEYNIKNIKIKCVDNISCDVLINYDYLEKINEDRDDVTYTTGTIYLNYIDNPKVLKKS